MTMPNDPTPNDHWNALETAKNKDGIYLPPKNFIKFSKLPLCLYNRELYKSRNLIEPPVWQVQGLSPHRHPVRPLCAYVLQCHLHSCHG